MRLVHDIGWLDVTVDHILFVRIGQGFRNARHNTQHNRHGQQLITLAMVRQVFALEEFHCDVGQVMLFSGIEYRDDILVLQATGRFCLSEKTFAGIYQLVTCKFLAQCHGFNSNHTPNFGIFAEVHHTHGALAQFFFDLVTAEHGFFYATAI